MNRSERIKAYSNGIDETHDGCEYSTSNYDSPKWEAELLNTGCRLVEITQNIETQNDHRHGERDESEVKTEKWKVFRKPALEEGDLGDNEKDSDGARNEV